MRQELTVAYDTNADMRDRIHSLQQQMAAIKAEAAARTPVGVTVEKVGPCLRQQALCSRKTRHELQLLLSPMRLWLSAGTIG